MHKTLKSTNTKTGGENIFRNSYANVNMRCCIWNATDCRNSKQKSMRWKESFLAWCLCVSAQFAKTKLQICQAVASFSSCWRAIGILTKPTLLFPALMFPCWQTVALMCAPKMGAYFWIKAFGWCFVDAVVTAPAYCKCSDHFDIESSSWNAICGWWLHFKCE